MRIATQARYGGPEVMLVREVPIPQPRASEVLVEMRAAALSLAECAFRKADPPIVRLFGGLFAPPHNRALGSEFSGVVAAVGEQVTDFQPGDAVFGATGAGLGAHAEYFLVDKWAAMIRRPAGLDHVEAAGLAYSFLTAMPFLRDEAKLRPGQHILINGAAGSVGLCAVQLARHMGARVTAVCGPRNVAFLQGLGVEAVIDYSRSDFTAARAVYDVIFDAVGKSSYRRCREALAPGGVYLTTVPSWAIVWAMLTRRPARLATTGLRPAAAKRRDLALIEGLIRDGALRPMTDRVFSLADIAAAHAYVDLERKRGEVVIVP